MSLSTWDEEKITMFQLATDCENRQNAAEYLETYLWDLTFAVNSYLDKNNHIENKNDIKSQVRKIDDNITTNRIHKNELEQKSTISSYNLHNSFDHEDILNTSGRTSFDEHVNQLLVPQNDITSPIYPDMKQFNTNKRQLLEYIDSNIIGKDHTIQTPWGTRKLIYADYTASGRGLMFIEHYMLTYVWPYYANTHSENNACALQTTKFRESSRALIKRCLHGNEEDVVIFTGAGSTAAINKLVDVLCLKDEENRNKFVVFVSTFEHHSNILPWKETGVEIVRIPNTKQGLLDQDALRQNLGRYYKVKNIICTFNAASNVTGIRTDVDTISTLVHEYDGWIFWDYAASAPYVKIDMNPSKTAYKDAVFMSPHKFVGGPSTPGILVAKKKLFKNKVPSGVGGGTVNFVTREETEYVQDIETREEGGTPNILGSIRAGLVFHLKESVGYDLIESREDELVEKFFQRFRNHPTLFILGSTTVKRIAIFSFLIYVPSIGKYLHHNFICSLLNDLFGIQVRSGCSCAGPYVLDLLNIDDQKAEIYTKFFTENVSKQLNEEHYIERNALMKPGFTRFNLSYFAGDEEVDYILNAVEFIANDGWKFLPLYSYDPDTAVWRPRDKPSEHDSSQYHSLRMITYENGIMEDNMGRTSQNAPLNKTTHRSIINSNPNDPITQARIIANGIPEYVYENVDFRTDPKLNIPDRYKNYVWFITPKEIVLKMLADLERKQQNNPTLTPFRPH